MRHQSVGQIGISKNKEDCRFSVIAIGIIIKFVFDCSVLYELPEMIIREIQHNIRGLAEAVILRIRQEDHAIGGHTEGGHIRVIFGQKTPDRDLLWNLMAFCRFSVLRLCGALVADDLE